MNKREILDLFGIVPPVIIDPKAELYTLALQKNLPFKEFRKLLNDPAIDNINIQKDIYGKVVYLTPLHILAQSGRISKKFIRKKYPWFKLDALNTFVILAIILF